jgi:hypothetical protein
MLGSFKALPSLILLLASLSLVSAQPIVGKSHIVIIPNQVVIEVFSFSGETVNVSKLAIELPEGSELLNVSGSVEFSDLKTEENLVLLRNVSIINGSHLALEYSAHGNSFRKRISFDTERLLILIPFSAEITSSSDNLFYKGKALLGQSNYSILEGNNLKAGEEIWLEFEERTPTQVIASADQKLNPLTLGGILLVVTGVTLLVLSKRVKSWKISEVTGEGDSEGKEREEKEEKKGRWEV